MLIVQILLILFFGSVDSFQIFLETCLIIGLTRLFTQCGTKWWFALIPCYRIYILGKCVAHETDGKIFFYLDSLSMLLSIVILILDHVTESPIYIELLRDVLALTSVIYLLRIASGIRELYGIRHRIWSILFLFLAGPLLILVCFNKKRKPAWQLSDLEGEANRFFSGSTAEVLEHGLTVNLESRSVPDFFSRKYLLRDIHMYIKPGRMVLMLGGSGAGKTTLLNAITGYEKAKADIMLNGHNVYGEYRKMLYDIGFVPQQDLMRENDTVENTLLDAARLRLPQNFTSSDRQDRVQDVMDIFGLTPVRNSLLGKLSGGQRKRASIALEFVANPSLFILDEPDSGLDGVMARELMQQLRTIADQGKIVIVITHTPDRVIDFFDDVIVLAKDSQRTGRLAFWGSIDEARSFFGREKMEDIVLSINRKEEGGEGQADEFIMKYAEVQHG